MGSPISPIVANIFMEHFENKILKDAPLKPSVWFRYVDDTFDIWSHGKEALHNFLTFLNSQHTNIKFTMERAAKQNFLSGCADTAENGWFLKTPSVP